MIKNKEKITVKLKKALGVEKVKENVLLAPLTTFGIGGPAFWFITAGNKKEILEAIKASRELKIPYFILGGGSNILIADQGFPGLVIRIKNEGLTIKGTKIAVEAGLPLAKLVEIAQKNLLSGLECGVGIPGTVGGAVCGNAGTREEWIGQKVAKVSIIDKKNKIAHLNNRDCKFSYRESRFKNNPQEVILEAVFNLKKEKREVIEQKIKSFLEARGNQPKEKSAGSVFKNPPGDSAGRLIDQAGLRGKKIGQAQISKKHANFIINTGGAKAEEVLKLIRLAQKTVKEKFNVSLELEIKLVGFNNETMKQ
jgi:UDP-N-acetylmuramate dehydrogenase